MGGIVEWLHAGILLATIAAIIYGPIKAVKITREMDAERAALERKLEVFRTLMKTRRVRMSFDHVGALNLIELEFYHAQPVLETYRAYIQHLNSPLPNPEEQGRHFEERHNLYVDMLHAIGHELGYNFDKHDLSRWGYAPVGWENDENRQRINAGLLGEILEGKRPFPIAPIQVGGGNPYPPPPEIEEE